jgi:hypothetical protein
VHADPRADGRARINCCDYSSSAKINTSFPPLVRHPNIQARYPVEHHSPVDEFENGYHFSGQFQTIEPTPMLLGFHANPKDHGQRRDS